MTDNEQMLMAIAAVAVLALVGRIIINRRSGSISWEKLIYVAAAATAFGCVFYLTDSYRLKRWVEGAAETSDAAAGKAVGRKAGDSIERVEKMTGTVIPLCFTYEAVSVEPTGYWKSRLSKSGDEATTREELVNKNDSSRIAIRRKTSHFDITRHPADEGSCVGIYRVELPSGERLLALIDPADAHTGMMPVSSTRINKGKMADIAAQDSTLLQDVSITSFDFVRYSADQTSLMLYKAIASLFAAMGGLIIVSICMIPIKKRRLSKR